MFMSCLWDNNGWHKQELRLTSVANNDRYKYRLNIARHLHCHFRVVRQWASRVCVYWWRWCWCRYTVDSLLRRVCVMHNMQTAERNYRRRPETGIGCTSPWSHSAGQRGGVSCAHYVHRHTHTILRGCAGGQRCLAYLYASAALQYFLYVVRRP